MEQASFFLTFNHIESSDQAIRKLKANNQNSSKSVHNI